MTSLLLQTKAVLEAGGAGAGADATWGPVTYWFLSAGLGQRRPPMTPSTRQTKSVILR